MTGFFPDHEGELPSLDPTAAETCPFVPPENPTEEYARRDIAERGGQRLFDGDNPYGVSFWMERELRDKYALMLQETPVKGQLLIARTLRRSFFAARGHAADVHSLAYLNGQIAENNPIVGENWPAQPDFYASTTVKEYSGSADRFMRAMVGMGEMASEQIQPRLSGQFMVAFQGVYRRYFVSLEQHKETYPREDVPVVSPDPEENWMLGIRGNGDNTLGVQLAHALAYYRQHPDANADDIWRSSLTSATVLSTAARVRGETFKKLGLKKIVPDFDAWETGEPAAFEAHRILLYAYNDLGLALPLSRSLSEGNDNYCSATLDIRHTDPYELEQIGKFSANVQERSDWPGVDDGQGGLLHENGIFNQATFQLMVGSIVGKGTIFPALVRGMQRGQGSRK